MKKKEVKRKDPKKKGKASQQRIEEEKELVKEKKDRINEETRKTMLGLVVEGRRPFHYGL